VIAVAKSADSQGELNKHGNDDPDYMLSEAVDGYLEHLLQSSKSRVCKMMVNNYVLVVLTINVLNYFKLIINSPC
jgi:hypothetical protein